MYSYASSLWFLYLVSGRESIKRTMLIGFECVRNIVILNNQAHFSFFFPNSMTSNQCDHVLKQSC